MSVANTTMAAANKATAATRRTEDRTTRGNSAKVVTVVELRFANVRMSKGYHTVQGTFCSVYGQLLSLLSGRTAARSGLRMMPTFPLSPLSFRTAGFPQYGWKVGLSGSAFPHVAQVKPAPDIPCSTRKFASAFRALRCPTLRPALCRNSGLGGALPFEESTPLPQRSSLRSGFYCPSPSTLNRPHPPHS
jgi:hypothetical protein